MAKQKFETLSLATDPAKRLNELAEAGATEISVAAVLPIEPMWPNGRVVITYLPKAKARVAAF